jgi:hypothetical protein
MTSKTEAGYIAWQWWTDTSDYSRPGRWSKTHRMVEHGRTLCGLSLPNRGDVADFGNEVMGNGTCQRCRKRASD